MSKEKLEKEVVVNGKVEKEIVVKGKIEKASVVTAQDLLDDLDGFIVKVKAVEGLSVKQQKSLISKAQEVTREAILPYAKATSDAKNYLGRLRKPNTKNEADGSICKMVMGIRDAAKDFTPEIPWGILVEYFAADSTGKKSMNLTSVVVDSVDSEGITGRYELSFPITIGKYVPKKRG